MLTRIESASALGLLSHGPHTVDRLAGAFADLLPTLSAEMLPGVWVGFVSEARDGDAPFAAHRMKASFRVVVAAMDRTAVRGLARDTRVLLAGQRFGLDMGYAVPAAVTPLAEAGQTVPGLYALALDFTATYTATDAADVPLAAFADTVPTTLPLADAMAVAAGLTEFRTAHAQWAVPSTPSDTVTLET